jgi:hypothetical protein
MALCNPENAAAAWYSVRGMSKLSVRHERVSAFSLRHELVAFSLAA